MAGNQPASLATAHSRTLTGIYKVILPGPPRGHSLAYLALRSDIPARSALKPVANCGTQEPLRGFTTFNSLVWVIMSFTLNSRFQNKDPGWVYVFST